MLPETDLRGPVRWKRVPNVCGALSHSPIGGEYLTALKTLWPGGQSFEPAVPFDRGQKGLRQGRSERPCPITREVASDGDGHGEHARAILAKHRDNLRETENVSLLSRLVGQGGASLEPTCLCLEFPGTGKNTGISGMTETSCFWRSIGGKSHSTPVYACSWYRAIL